MLLDAKRPRLSLYKPDTSIQIVSQMDFMSTQSLSFESHFNSIKTYWDHNIDVLSIFSSRCRMKKDMHNSVSHAEM